MLKNNIFEIKGYFKEYYTINGKYLGSLKCEKDRETFGYHGRKEEILSEKVTFKNKTHINPKTKVVTQLQRICGKMLQD